MILALDPAESTGYAIVNTLIDDTTSGDSTDDISSNREKKARIIKYGHIDVKKSDVLGERCVDLRDKLSKLIDEYDIKDVVVEDYFFAHKTANGSNNNPAFRTAIYILCVEKNISYTIVNPVVWKKHITGGFANPSKQQKDMWGKEKSKKIFIQDALWKRRRVRFPNHSISNLTNKPIDLRYDEVDAVAQAIYYCESILNYGNVTVCDPTEDCPKMKGKYTYI